MSLLPTPRAALVAAGLAIPAGLLGGWTALFVVDAVLVVVLVADALWCVSPNALRVSRTLPVSMALGQRGRLAWRVHNPTNRSVRVALADELPPSWQCRDRRARLVVPKHATVTRRRSIRPARRGRFAIAEVTVRTTGPLGLSARQATIAVPGALRVIPAFPSRKEAELRLDRNRLIEVGLRTSKGRGGGTDFDQLREYQIDDEYRRVDWAATARRGHPVVRTYRAERNQQLLVLLDTGRIMAPTVAGAARLEHALDAVMALAVAAGRLGDRVAFSAHDVEPRADLPPLDRPDRAVVLVDAMVELQPRLVETDYRRAFATLESRFRRRSLVVVLTDLAEAVTVEQLLPQLRLLTRRHLVIVAAVSDPAVHRRADAPAADIDEVYRKAGASQVLEKRAQIVATLTQAGVLVIEDEPRKVALRLVEAYLTVKTEQRL